MARYIKNNNFIRKVMLFCMGFFSVINKIIPKNEKKILFYDSGRSFLDDNTEALYTYLLDNGYDKKYKLVCCVPNQTKTSPFNNYHPVGALKGVIAYLTAKYVFYSFGDFRIKPTKQQIVVNQWHGMPLKKIGKYTNDSKYLNERLDNFTYLLASSEMYKPIMAKAFGCNLDRVKILGAARIDYFYSEKDALTPFGIDRNNYEKLIIWMPTFRQSIDGRFYDGMEENETLLPIFYTYESMNGLDSFLEENNLLIVIKVHPMAKFRKVPFKRIIIMTNEDIVEKGIRLYEFIKEFDSLITDYSTIYNEYVLLNRPMAFTIDDQEQYDNSRGFLFENILDLLPGPHLKNEEDFYSCLKDIKSGNDDYEFSRSQINHLVNKYERNNCKRLVEFVGLSL